MDKNLSTQVPPPAQLDKFFTNRTLYPALLDKFITIHGPLPCSNGHIFDHDLTVLPKNGQIFYHHFAVSSQAVKFLTSTDIAAQRLQTRPVLNGGAGLALGTPRLELN